MTASRQAHPPTLPRRGSPPAAPSRTATPGAGSRAGLVERITPHRARRLAMLGVLIAGLSLASGCSEAPQQEQQQESTQAEETAASPPPETRSIAKWPPRPQGEPREISWPELAPPDYDPEGMLERSGVMELDDLDPRGQEILDQLRTEWDQAPLVEWLDGQHIKMPGYVVPLEADRDQVSEFLLVPYYGACIHVPPPPANQTVYVTTRTPATIPEMFAVVWVTGVMTTQRIGSDLGTAGYVLYAESVEPFDL
ncbi:MAG: DUF3299 domain-containing protein [Halothiobacillaceae bacterium]